MRNAQPEVQQKKVPRAGPHPLEGVAGCDIPDPEPISAAMLKDSRDIAETFSDYVAQCFLSKTWSLREAALQKMILEIPKVSTEIDPALLFAAVTRTLQMCAKERVSQVFSRSMDLVRALLSIIPANMRKAEVSSALELYTTALVEKLGNANARINKMPAIPCKPLLPMRI